MSVNEAAKDARTGSETINLTCIIPFSNSLVSLRESRPEYQRILASARLVSERKGRGTTLGGGGFRFYHALIMAICYGLFERMTVLFILT